MFAGYLSSVSSAVRTMDARIRVDQRTSELHPVAHRHIHFVLPVKAGRAVAKRPADYSYTYQELHGGIEVEAEPSPIGMFLSPQRARLAVVTRLSSRIVLSRAGCPQWRQILLSRVTGFIEDPARSFLVGRLGSIAFNMWLHSFPIRKTWTVLGLHGNIWQGYLSDSPDRRDNAGQPNAFLDRGRTCAY
jgi:hypothetical protein